MKTIEQVVNGLVNSLSRFVPQLIAAIIILSVGWLVALSLKRLTALLLSKVGVDRRIPHAKETSLAIEPLLTGLVYYIALVYVLILTLSVLGMEGVLDPLKVMLSTFISSVPNIVAALLIAFLGYILARIFSNLVTAVAVGADKLAAQAKLPVTFSLSKLLGQLVFLFIFIPTLVVALDVLQITAISNPATEMLGSLMNAVPQILAAAVILTVAYVVGRFVTEVLGTLLSNLGADGLPTAMGMEQIFGKTTFSKVIANTAFFFIMLGASVAAVEKLRLPALTGTVNTLLEFAGQILLGLIILAVGTWIARLAHTGLSRTAARGVVAGVARAAILVLVIAMGLRAMGIADDIVNLAFLLGLGSVAVAFALSFGLGGREAAGRQLEYWMSKLRKEDGE
ncbi:MAG: mechanosensitive ion channel [Opitutales bacterium]